MKVKLYDYQQKIVNQVINNGDPAVALLMSMGTGKTYTSLAIFEQWRLKNKVTKLLVVCIKNKIEDWKTDIKEQFDIGLDYEVINFESIWRTKRAEYYKNFVDDKTLIIIDESQKIKNPKSKVSKYLLELYNQTKYKILLSGTPEHKLYIDYYPQMKFINSPTFDIPLKDWEKKYVIKMLDCQSGHYFYKIIGYNFENELKKAITEKSYYQDYLATYEKPQEIDIKLDQSKEAKQFKKDKVYIAPDGDDVLGDTQISLRIYMRQSVSGFIKNHKISSPKADWLADFLEITQNTRIVIFCNFIMEIELVSEICKKAGRPIGYYYGAKKDLSPFQENENGVIICNYQSASTGINSLCISNIAIFYSPPEDVINFEQAKARIDRIGQTKQPMFYYLKTKGSIEMEIYNALKKGQDFNQEMFDYWVNLRC